MKIGKYISMNSREGFWGKGAIEVISQQLAKELPGLRGFSVTNLKSMRLFYEEWSFLQEEKPADSISAVATAELDMLNQKQALHCFLPRSFLQIGFTHHIVILRNSKELSERLFYIHRCEEETVLLLKSHFIEERNIRQKTTLRQSLTVEFIELLRGLQPIVNKNNEYLEEIVKLSIKTAENKLFY